ncbi:uncharacterized protein ISCGN_030184 [Ixodes scapularis]
MQTIDIKTERKGAAQLVVSQSVIAKWKFLNLPFLADRCDCYRSHLSIPISHKRKVWNAEQECILEEMRSAGGAHLSGDGRCDSPGFSAKYGTYSFYSNTLNKIVHTEQVQVGENDAVQASSHMEKVGFMRGFNYLQENNIDVLSFTTDRHVSIKKEMATNHPDVSHYFDVWHFAKGITNKLRAASKRPQNKDLKRWMEKVTNHVYWCAAIGNGDGQVVLDAWKTITRHIINVHDGHEGSISRCMHGPLHNKLWLNAESSAYQAFMKVALAPLLLRDIRQLSPSFQTYSLESFHSVLIGFAPKSTVFTYEGMRARILLAVLHFNANAKRLQATTKDGQGRYKVKASKSRKDHLAAFQMAEGAKFEYISTLMTNVLERLERLPSFREAASELSTPPPPPPMIARVQPRPSKADLVAVHKSRFGKA